jgi:hypothetical protein
MGQFPYIFSEALLFCLYLYKKVMTHWQILTAFSGSSPNYFLSHLEMGTCSVFTFCTLEPKAKKVCGSAKEKRAKKESESNKRKRKKHQFALEAQFQSPKRPGIGIGKGLG